MNHFIEFASSAQGANHIKVNKVCQDASGSYSDGLTSIIAVADGHGSDNYPRTQKGSAFAVDAAIGAIRDFVEAAEQFGIDVYAEQKGRFRDLSLNILKRWYGSVNSDLESHPFLEAELGKVSDSYKKRYSSGERCEKAYGTTLIAVCATPNYWFGLHIGDGKCVAIDKNGECFEPIPWDANCQANITTSICDSDAIDEFRFFCGQEFPLGIFIGSDGIDDSYAGDVELYDLYRTVLCLFAEQGAAVGKNEIKDFLPGISKSGSGDDVSMAGLIRSSISRDSMAWVSARKEYETARREFQRCDKEAIVAEEKYIYIQDELQKTKETCANAKERLEHASAVKGEDASRLRDIIEKTTRILEDAETRLTQADSLRDQAASKRAKAEARLRKAEQQLEKLRSAQKEPKSKGGTGAGDIDGDEPSGSKSRRRAQKSKKPAKKRNRLKLSKRKKRKKH